MTPISDLAQLAAQWKTARLLYPLYAALAREFVIDLPPCSDLESGVVAPPQESVEQARQWFLDMDARIGVHQLRQFLQTTTLATDDGLRALLEHYLQKNERTDSDRDKIDFLLVQYFSHCAPSRLDDGDVDAEYVAEVLAPVLGQVELTPLPWIQPLEDVLEAAKRCQTLNELLNSGILEKGRKRKVACGKNYFQPAAMVRFTRFSFLMRRVFFRLMHQDLNAILDGLRVLEERGVNTLDCRRAQFSAEEPTVRLRMICQSWKVMFHAEYSSGQPLRMLVDLRAIVENALSRTRGLAAKKGQEPRAQAAAASAKSAVKASSNVPEFEVSTASDWDPEASANHNPNKGSA